MTSVPLSFITDSFLICSWQRFALPASASMLLAGFEVRCFGLL